VSALLALEGASVVIWFIRFNANKPHQGAALWAFWLTEDQSRWVKRLEIRQGLHPQKDLATVLKIYPESSHQLLKLSKCHQKDFAMTVLSAGHVQLRRPFSRVVNTEHYHEDRNDHRQTD
jgi:hypothetical protein